MNNSNIEFKLKLKRKVQMWNIISIVALIFVTAMTAFLSWSRFKPENNIVFTVLISFGVAMLMLELIQKIHQLLEVTLLKDYWIEDCGSVLKLHGSVRAINMHHAYRDILNVRPGFKIVDNAYEKFGCTMAAIQATQNELIAKKEIESFGIEVTTIG